MSKILTDAEIIERHAPSVRHRAMIELAVVHRLIQDLTKAGYRLKYDDGNDTPGEFDKVRTEQEAIDFIFAVDEATVYAYDPAEGGPQRGWFTLIMGNDGTDVISDYNMGMDSFVQPIFDWIEKEETAGRF